MTGREKEDIERKKNNGKNNMMTKKKVQLRKQNRSQRYQLARRRYLDAARGDRSGLYVGEEFQSTRSFLMFAW